MQQFQVPKFIDIETKILGPLNLTQTAVIGLAAAIIFVLRFFVEPFIFFPAAIIIAVLAFVMMFFRVNERSMGDFFVDAIIYFISPRVYIWGKPEQRSARPMPVRGKKTNGQKIAPPDAAMSLERLRNLAKELDILEK